MLLVDFSNLSFMSVLDFQRRTGIQPSMSDIRNLVIGQLTRVMKDQKKFGEVVICDDGKNYWRKSAFPNYKSERKQGREDSTFDWDKFFPLYEKLKEEIRENIPAKFLQVNGAEADDIIAILALRYGRETPVCIWSSDTDNLQIQALAPNVKQFSPIKKKFITQRSEEYSLFEHIVRGDRGDGIPNILSPADSFITKTKQKSVTKAKLSEWEKNATEPEKFCDASMLTRFNENKTIIDYQCIPANVADKIIESYENTKAPKGKLFTYLINNKMSNVIKEGGF